MPTARFVVTAAPIEAQLTTSLSAQLRDTVALALRLKRRVNDTLHDEELSEKAGNVLLDVVQPGGLPFMLFVLLITVLVVRELLLRREARRILKAHRDHSVASMVPPKHEHGD